MARRGGRRWFNNERKNEVSEQIGFPYVSFSHGVQVEAVGGISVGGFEGVVEARRSANELLIAS